MVELKLTKRQQEIFDYVKRYSAEHGYPPTVRDIGKAIGLTSSSTVHAHLANLEKLGLLRRDPDQAARDRDLVGQAEEGASGRRPADGRPGRGGSAGARGGEHRGVRRRCPAIAGGDEGEYVLRVQGDSMKNAGHPRGRPRRRPPPGHRERRRDHRGARGEEATVKRFFKENDHIRLQPENEPWSRSASSDVQVLGRVVGVCRRVS